MFCCWGKYREVLLIWGIVTKKDLFVGGRVRLGVMKRLLSAGLLLVWAALGLAQPGGAFDGFGGIGEFEYSAAGDAGCDFADWVQTWNSPTSVFGLVRGVKWSSGPDPNPHQVQNFSQAVIPTQFLK